ncbi:hypothetical protein A3206_05770 [Candidatus Methanomassiliicoccus intestinalis]|jgi:hypothetical protein|uniref:Uncharacterized protein n=2 Tax=Candidatus Methanomassiliicoccus intestinalis TaxID=1406512 RepID=R9T7K4_METII|nr:hypothetical protein MMINT_13050 [Candidatus Methanomassiliicoccus intestinalis Issoire-Mx1]TQS83561.1 MAG: hypothetical protein A3206_05770 [Candidatus Methanomassiliicoccus intestinalis]
MYIPNKLRGGIKTMRKIPAITTTVLIATVLLILAHLHLTYVNDGDVTVYEFSHVVLIGNVVILFILAYGDMKWYEFFQTCIGKASMISIISVITATIIIGVTYSHETWLNIIAYEILIAIGVELILLDRAKLGSSWRHKPAE